MKIKSYAKLNLTLEIDGKNSNGYHKISGVFQNISLFDEIIIKESKKHVIFLFFRGPGAPQLIGGPHGAPKIIDLLANIFVY